MEKCPTIPIIFPKSTIYSKCCGDFPNFIYTNLINVFQKNPLTIIINYWEFYKWFRMIFVDSFDITESFCENSMNVVELIKKKFTLIVTWYLKNWMIMFFGFCIDIIEELVEKFMFEWFMNLCSTILIEFSLILYKYFWIRSALKKPNVKYHTLKISTYNLFSTHGCSDINVLNFLNVFFLPGSWCCCCSCCWTSWS